MFRFEQQSLSSIPPIFLREDGRGIKKKRKKKEEEGGDSVCVCAIHRTLKNLAPR